MNKNHCILNEISIFIIYKHLKKVLSIPKFLKYLIESCTIEKVENNFIW